VSSQSVSDQQTRQMESGLGIMDYRACSEASTSTTSKRSNKYVRWSDKERFEIGKYASIHGSRAAERKYHTQNKPLNESSARRFAKAYKEEIRNARKGNRDVNKGLTTLPRGRPLMLGSLDEMVRRFLLSVRRTGGLVSSAIAVAAAKALIARNPQFNLDHIDLDSSSWSQSLFRRMGFKRRMRTTGKVEIPEGAKKEAELLFLHSIVKTVEKYQIPHSLIINLDQTPLKYIPAMNHTMAKQNSKNVAIAGSSDKRSITGTFTVTLDGRFLPMQLIYGGKTKQSLPRFEFPKDFSLSCNPKHFSNTEESVKLINEIILPYVENQRKEMEKPKQPALVIMDVFRGQITDDVTSLLTENDIHFIFVPNNMTHLYQPLDLTVNKHSKTFLKKLFSEWYAQQIENQLALGKKVEEINIQFRLSTLKPLHAKWLMQYYNEITSEAGRSIIINGWKAAGISDALELGSSGLPSIDPFQDISPLSNTEDLVPPPTATNALTDDLRQNFVNDIEEEESSDWEGEEEDGTDQEEEEESNVHFDRNAFIMIDDELSV